MIPTPLFGEGLGHGVGAVNDRGVITTYDEADSLP
jgi:hypothetical protein